MLRIVTAVGALLFCLKSSPTAHGLRVWQHPSALKAGSAPAAPTNAEKMLVSNSVRVIFPSDVAQLSFVLRGGAGDAVQKFSFPSRDGMVAVGVAGDWNGWTPQPLTLGEDGVWSADIAVSEGEHMYKYVLNGNDWVVSDEDPVALDATGNMNNVRTAVASATDAPASSIPSIKPPQEEKSGETMLKTEPEQTVTKENGETGDTTTSATFEEANKVFLAAKEAAEKAEVKLRSLGSSKNVHVAEQTPGEDTRPGAEATEASENTVETMNGRSELDTESDRRASVEAIDKEQSVTATQRLGQAVQPVREAKQPGDENKTGAAASRVAEPKVTKLASPASSGSKPPVSKSPTSPAQQYEDESESEESRAVSQAREGAAKAALRREQEAARRAEKALHSAQELAKGMRTTKTCKGGAADLRESLARLPAAAQDTVRHALDSARALLRSAMEDRKVSVVAAASVVGLVAGVLLPRAPPPPPPPPPKRSFFSKK
jgi:hypothetical protein